MPHTRLLGVLLAGTALTVTGCSAPEPPEITFYADGTAVEVAPVKYCDVRITRCTTDDRAHGRLVVRPGRPVQISVPPQVAETPWTVFVQAVDADGNPLPPREHTFVPDKAFAYTARPANPDERIAVIEVHQAGVAANQLVSRGVWTLELRPR